MPAYLSNSGIKRQRMPDLPPDEPPRWRRRVAKFVLWPAFLIGWISLLVVIDPNQGHRGTYFGNNVAVRLASALPVEAVINCLRRNSTKRLHLYTSRHLIEPNLLVNEPQNLLVRVDARVGGSVITVLLRSGDTLSPVHRAALYRCTG